MSHTHDQDVLIIGAGLAGVISAYLLAKAGKKVILIEKNKIGSGATAKTTAFLTQVVDTNYSDLIKMCGLEAAKIVADSHGAAITLIQKIVAEENIDCDFIECNDYIFANTHKNVSALLKEFAALRKVGISAKFESGNKLGFPNAGYVEIEKQAKFDAQKFIIVLAKKAEKYGAVIHENTEAISIQADGSGATVQTKDGKEIKAHWAIVATYEPFNKPFRLYFKKAFYTSYVLQVDIPKNVIQEAIYEDSCNPYHYFRIDRGEEGDVMTLGGEDHRSDVPVNPKKCFKALEQYFKKTFPTIPLAIRTQWTGPILESVDGLAYIGPLDKSKILYALAFSGNGMTYSAIAAMMFKDLVFGQENRWVKVYRTDRIPGITSLLFKGRDYSQEMINGALKNTFKSNNS